MKHVKKKTKKRDDKPGHAPRRDKEKHHPRGQKPDVETLIVTHINEEGDAVAVPEKWPVRKQPPVIFITDNRPGISPGVGDRLLATMRKMGKYHFNARVIRILPKEPPKTAVGILMMNAHGNGVIEPVSRKSKETFFVGKDDISSAKHGELVIAGTMPGVYEHGLPCARIQETLGDARAPRAASLIAAHMHRLPMVFSAAALAEAEAAPPPVMTAKREDLRAVPLVTIDGEDARDFDDAVFAEADTSHENPGGFHMIVAIADVAHYVPEHSALDADAFTRGNSAYFPDRVIPMLPERLSNGLCSLKPEEDRYCLAVHMWLDKGGHVKRYRFTRGLMRSHARLTYTQVEHAEKTIADPKIKALVANLNAGYHALARERDKRGTLALNLPEYKVHFDEAGNVDNIAPKPSLESHRLIESYMVAANVAAADFLLKQKSVGIYRVHEAPGEEKLEDLRKFLGLSGYSFPKGAITPTHLNQVLRKSEGAPNAAMIHTAVLRSQMQAFYGEKNLGHFGLALKAYCHFTSPIRRYSDLVVHRALVALLEPVKAYAPENLKDVAKHISETERTAMMAERDAMDRYKISYLARQKENVFEGTIHSINEHGLFVSLVGNGITGFVPVHHLGDDFFLYEPRMARFKGRGTGRVFKMGEPLTVRVMEADPLKGSLIFRPEINGRQKKEHFGKQGKNKASVERNDNSYRKPRRKE